MSLNLPTMGNASVAATMYEVAGQVYRSNPPTSAMIRGIVVATTVWLRAPRNMASTTQIIDAMACRGGGGAKAPSSGRPVSFGLPSLKSGLAFAGTGCSRSVEPVPVIAS